MGGGGTEGWVAGPAAVAVSGRWVCPEGDAGFAPWGSAVPCPHSVFPGLAVGKQSWEQWFSVLTQVCDRLMALP